MFNSIEKKVIKTLIDYNLLGSKMMLGVSGGFDSMTLLDTMYHISKKFKITLNVAHFHHGGSSIYREKALKFVRKQTELREIEFFYKKHNRSLVTETECRSKRLEFLNSIAKSKGCDVLVTAHHMDDLLETRILRLIRGVGLGGLSAMKVFENGLFRPFLNIPKDELLLLKTVCLEDPSNLDNTNIRNWVRNVWLCALKKRFPEGVRNMHRSLDLVSNAKRLDLSDCVRKQGLDRRVLSSYSTDLRHQAIADYMLLKCVRNYSCSQISEVEKRLRSNRKNFKFKVAKRLWLVDTTHVSLDVN